MELRDLWAFVAVAQEQHSGGAAERLYISPPPLFNRIKALEEEVGALLLERTTRHVALSAATQVLLEHVRAPMQAALAATRRLCSGADCWQSSAACVKSRHYFDCREGDGSKIAEVSGILLAALEMGPSAGTFRPI